MCPTVENPDLVCQKAGYSQSTTQPWPSERDSRQAIQTGSDHSNGMVPQSRGIPSNMPPVAPIHCLSWEGTGPVRLSTNSHLGQSGGEVAGLPMQQNHTGYTGMAQHALVLGSSGNVQPDSPVSAQHTQSGV